MENQKTNNNNFIINLENVEKNYDLGNTKVNVLKNINIKITANEFLSIMGPSGSGKTTLMNLIGCLDKPTSGNIFLDSIDLLNLDDDELAEIRNKKIGFVFQNFNLLAKRTALENIEIPLVYAGMNKKDRIQKAKELLYIVGLEKRMFHCPNELSGGEKQRVAIARALTNNPKIILADEPTGNLDSASGEEIIKTFHHLNEQGVTIILVTHNKEIAQNTSRIIYLKDGLIQD